MLAVSPLETAQRVWKTDAFALCQLGIRAEKLATDLGIRLDHWHEDGLGQACGFACRLPSGLVLLFQELAHAIEYLGGTGAEVYVDASDFASQGPTALIAELITAFHLNATDLRWTQPVSAIESAQAICAHIAASREPNLN